VDDGGYAAVRDLSATAPVHLATVDGQPAATRLGPA
jgi:hypothetical protein